MFCFMHMPYLFLLGFAFAAVLSPHTLHPHSLSVRAAITNYYKAGWLLNGRDLFLTVLEAGDSVPADSVSDKAHFSHGRRGKEALWDLFIRVLISCMRASLSWPNHLLKSPTPRKITSTITFKHMNF